MKRLLGTGLLAGLLVLGGCGGSAAPAAPAASHSSSASQSKPAASSSSASTAASTTGSTAAPSNSGGSGATTPAGTAKLKNVTLLLDWLIEGYQAPYYLGIQQGFFKDAGLNLKIIPGKGSISTAQQIGHDNYQFGFADAESVATAVSQGVPIKVVGDFLQVSPVAIITLDASHIAKPSDLIGKTIGSAPGSSSYNLLPAFLAANHLSKSQVKVQTMSNAALLGALKAGKVAGVTEYDIDTLPQLQADGIPATDLPFAKWGVPGLSLGIIVNNSYLASNAATVKAFVQATQKSWQYAETHQQQAIAAEKAIAGSVPPGALGMLKLAYASAHTANSQGHPFGWMASQDWTQTLSIVKKYLGVSATKPPSDYYTNQFIAS